MTNRPEKTNTFEGFLDFIFLVFTGICKWLNNIFTFVKLTKKVG